MATDQPNADIQLNYPPIILGATEDVIPDPLVPQPVRGLPLSLFRMVFNQKLGVLANAVTVLVPPPAREGTGNDPISIGLVLNGNPLEEKQIPDDDRDKTTSFYLFESTLRDGSNNKLEYKVRRPTGNVGDSTPLYLLYRSHLPGGNSVPGDDDHPYLDISLPAELGDPAMIGKDEMDAGVPLTVFYPFMYDYDVIHYKLQSERFTYIVQPREAGSPVVITLTRAMFELAGNSANFEISYTVISQLNNPTDKRRESKTLLAEVDKDLHFFAKPILREVQSESGDNPAIIDRGKLAGNPLLAVVVPSAPKFKPGDTVEGRYTATPSGTNQPFTGTIEEDGFGGFKPCIMYIPNDKVVANDDVVATYSLLRGGTVVGKSDKAEAHVKGEDSIALDPPTLKSPATNPINVLEYDLGVTVQVTFAGNPGDQARLKELNPAPGAVPFPTQDIIAGQSDFNLSQTYLAVRQNSVIELTWELIRGGVRAGESAALRLNVNRMIDGDPRLTTPTAPPGNITSTLDLSSFTGNTTAQLKAWRGIALGQSLWQSCEGTNSSGAPVTLPIYQGLPIGSVGDQSSVVTRAFLEQLADGSQIRVLAAVNFDGVANEATAVKFPERAYTVKTEPTVKLVFSNGPYTVVPAGRVQNIVISLSTDNEDPVANGEITLTLPSGFTYYDGGIGDRKFTTDNNGLIKISQINGPQASKTYSLTAKYHFQTTTEAITVTALEEIGRIPLNFIPYKISISPNGLWAYAISHTPIAVMTIDIFSRKEINRRAMESASFDIAVDKSGQYLFICNYNSSSVSVIDTETLQLVKDISTGFAPYRVVINNDNSLAYISNAQSKLISVIDIPTLEVIRNLPTEARRGTGIIAVSPDNRIIYAAIGEINDQSELTIISKIDTVTGITLKSVNVRYTPKEMIISSDGARLYTFRVAGQIFEPHIELIDTNSMIVTKNFDTPALECGTLNIGNTLLYCGTSFESGIRIIDAYSGIQNGTIPIVNKFTNIIINASGTRLYTSGSSSHDIEIVSTT
ncbi:YncE family protein [Pseudomonas nunensis]|uniref:YncE family protein n=1 Tax=Pseudomonas nunensis TaxID=2961896 RepID=UPI0006B611D1|nr:YncE family protein [Pseudomonas nunensis]KOY02799.1 hypothetical protein AM274_08245 [Pseudomonas nunensis]